MGTTEMADERQRRSNVRPASTQLTEGQTASLSAIASAEDGSMVSEYGLVAVLGATIAGLAISWAKGGAVASLLAAVLAQLRTVVLA